MKCKKINLSTWSTPLKAKNHDVGELQFSHINWVSRVETKVSITVNTGDISKFQKEFEALLSKYHIHNIWEKKEARRVAKPETEPTVLEKALKKHGLNKENL